MWGVVRRSRKPVGDTDIPRMDVRLICVLESSSLLYSDDDDDDDEDDDSKVYDIKLGISLQYGKN